MDAITIDFRYAEIEYELWALGHMLGVIEPAIERLSRDSEETILVELRRTGGEDDDAEWDLAWQDIREIQEHVLPRFMRGPFVVSVWASFEGAVRSVAKTMQSEAHSSIAFAGIRRPIFPVRARSYFATQFDFALDEDEDRFERLTDLYKVRNGLAHTNGLKEGMSDRDWDSLEAALARSGIEPGGFSLAVVLPRDYVERAYRDVTDCVRSLIKRARAATTHHQ